MAVISVRMGLSIQEDWSYYASIAMIDKLLLSPKESEFFNTVTLNKGSVVYVKLSYEWDIKIVNMANQIDTQPFTGLSNLGHLQG